MYIDSHTHLYAEEFKDDFQQVYQNALNHGVGQFLLPNIDVGSIEGILHLVRQYPQHFKKMMGLHPCSVGEDFKAQLEVIKPHAFEKECIAIGEIGIDLYWDKTFLPQQIEAFSLQIEWALQLNLPIVIHARDSFAEIFKLMESYRGKGLRGVFHCFTGGEKEVEFIRAYEGFIFGIGGVLTFKNAGLDKTVEKISLSEIILETDAPYLSPVPHRGKRNESAYIPLVAKKLAELKNVDLSEIELATTENCKKLFNLNP